ncbi:esterase/lipase family protein [Pseudonocardia sp. GCM10023141]|uniref:esterase/lipase family protein n=1 Tax=Pseudonocardia sp. GCM10023141 TaxID=3252653 RepID=UPI0036068718
MDTEQRSDRAPALGWYLADPVRAVTEFGLHLASRPLRAHLPTGDGHPVLVIPGLLAADSSTRPLRGSLRRLGYHVHGWRLGRNIGPTEHIVDGMRDRLFELADRHGRPVTVIGWSLGGIFARELARRTPDAVRQVITLGSPIRLECESQTRAFSAFEQYSHLHVEKWELPLEHGCEPLAVPATSVYSRTDGIVAWEACLDEVGPRTENIAVVGSHIGLGHNPGVLWAVADRLAQPEGTWRPFRSTPLWRRLFPNPVDLLPAPLRKPAGGVAA